MEMLSLLVFAAAAGLSGFAIVATQRARRAVEASEVARQAAVAAARAELDRAAARARSLQREVETLSAIREVSLIANDDVSFEGILGDVLKIIEDLIEASEIAIFIADDQGTSVKPRAVRRAGESRFGEAADVEDPSLVDEAFKLRRTLRRIERGELHLATLLFADREIGGVLAARAPVHGRSEEEVAAIEAALEALAKHVALAIKKPTLYDKAVIDALTRLYTKRHFASQLARICASSRRTGARFSLVIADVDHFKKVNDTHGHLTGDLVLSEVATTLKATIRESDEAFRYGGEEMVVIAGDSDLEAGRGLAERLRAAIEQKALRGSAGQVLKVTASFGVSTFGPGTDTPAALIEAADKALYVAKQNGRNRVFAAGDAPPKPPEPPPLPPAKPRRARAKVAKSA